MNHLYAKEKGLLTQLKKEWPKSMYYSFNQSTSDECYDQIKSKFFNEIKHNLRKYEIKSDSDSSTASTAQEMSSILEKNAIPNRCEK